MSSRIKTEIDRVLDDANEALYTDKDEENEDLFKAIDKLVKDDTDKVIKKEILSNKNAMKTSNGKNIHCCDICGYKSNNKNKLNIHLKSTKHIGNAQTKRIKSLLNKVHTKNSSTTMANNEYKSPSISIKKVVREIVNLPDGKIKEKSIENYLFSCDLCDFKSNKRDEVKTHQKSKTHMMNKTNKLINKTKLIENKKNAAHSTGKYIDDQPKMVISKANTQPNIVIKEFVKNIATSQMKLFPKTPQQVSTPLSKTFLKRKPMSAKLEDEYKKESGTVNSHFTRKGNIFSSNKQVNLVDNVFKSDVLTDPSNNINIFEHSHSEDKKSMLNLLIQEPIIKLDKNETSPQSQSTIFPSYISFKGIAKICDNKSNLPLKDSEQIHKLFQVKKVVATKDPVCDDNDYADFECKVCRETFWYKSQLYDHLKKIHPGSDFYKKDSLAKQNVTIKTVTSTNSKESEKINSVVITPDYKPLISKEPEKMYNLKITPVNKPKISKEPENINSVKITPVARKVSSMKRPISVKETNGPNRKSKKSTKPLVKDIEVSDNEDESEDFSCKVVDCILNMSNYKFWYQGQLDDHMAKVHKS